MAANEAIVNVSADNRPAPVESALSAIATRAVSEFAPSLQWAAPTFNYNPSSTDLAEVRSAASRVIGESARALVSGARQRAREVANQFKIDPNLSLSDASMVDLPLLPDSFHADTPNNSISLDLFDDPISPIRSSTPARARPKPESPYQRPAQRARKSSGTTRAAPKASSYKLAKYRTVHHPGTSMSARARHYAAKYGRARTYYPRTTRYTKKTYRRKAAPRKTTTRRRYTRKADTLTKVRLTVADQVINRPFARNRNPRLPDGSAIESHGRQFRMVQDINLSPNSVYVMHVYPGLHSGVLVYKEDEFNSPNAQWIVPRGLGSAATDGNIFGQAFVHEAGVNDPVAGWENTTALPPYADGGTQTGRKDLDFWSSKNIERWRMLSNGVHVNLLNNLDEADGWFEACRTPMENNCSALYFTDSNLGASTTGNPGISFQPGEVGQFCLSYVAAINPKSMNMAQQPGYLTGSLRDINKVMFRSKKIGQSHSWISGTEHSYIDNQIMQVTEPITSIVHTGLQCFPSQQNSPQAVMDKLTDRNFDTVFIRIHTGSVGSGANKAKLLVDYVANHEYVYDTGSTYASFQTKNIGV